MIDRTGGLDPDPLYVSQLAVNAIEQAAWDEGYESGVLESLPPRWALVLVAFTAAMVGALIGFTAANAASPAAVEPFPVVRPQPGAWRPSVPDRQRPALIGAAPIGDAASAAPGPDTAATLSGTASWYPASGLIAAAGPALRHGDWRGSTVTVSAGGRSVTVTLSDFCQCYGSRLIDLSDDAFRRLAPLSRGLLRVSVADVDAATIPPTDEELP